ncbi:MAG: hypothetical protein ABSA46_13720 [Thermodesulfovibrionales bacterium]|jgi:hypothetical protein
MTTIGITSLPDRGDSDSLFFQKRLLIPFHARISARVFRFIKGYYWQEVNFPERCSIVVENASICAKLSPQITPHDLVNTLLRRWFYKVVFLKVVAGF